MWATWMTYFRMVATAPQSRLSMIPLMGTFQKTVLRKRARPATTAMPKGIHAVTTTALAPSEAGTRQRFLRLGLPGRLPVSRRLPGKHSLPLRRLQENCVKS